MRGIFVKTMKRTPGYIFFLLLLLPACSGEKSKPSILNDSLFVNFQADFMIAQEESRLDGNDSLSLPRKTDSLYSYYHLTPARHDSLMTMISTDLESWKEFHLKVVKRLEYLYQTGAGFSRSK
jgi:hypothetical protein